MSGNAYHQEVSDTDESLLSNKRCALQPFILTQETNKKNRQNFNKTTNVIW